MKEDGFTWYAMKTRDGGSLDSPHVFCDGFNMEKVTPQNFGHRHITQADFEKYWTVVKVEVAELKEKS